MGQGVQSYVVLDTKNPSLHLVQTGNPVVVIPPWISHSLHCGEHFLSVQITDEFFNVKRKFLGSLHSRQVEKLAQFPQSSGHLKHWEESVRNVPGVHSLQDPLGIVVVKSEPKPEVSHDLHYG